MSSVIIASSSSESQVLIRSESHADIIRIKLASPTLEAIENFMDIQTGLRTEALYREHGRSAFRSYDEYRAKRLGQGV